MDMMKDNANSFKEKMKSYYNEHQNLKKSLLHEIKYKLKNKTYQVFVNLITFQFLFFIFFNVDCEILFPQRFSRYSW
jgi:hypothetical protein